MQRTTDQRISFNRLVPNRDTAQDTGASGSGAQPSDISRLRREFAGLQRPTGSQSRALGTLATANRTANFNDTLARWAHLGPPGESISRNQAMAEIKAARDQHSTALDLTELNLTSLPQCLSELTSLEKLDVSDNCLTQLPPLPPALIELKANYNDMTHLPALPASLQYLFVENNQLVELPSMPGRIAELFAGGNCLTRLPALPRRMDELSIHDNVFTELPSLPPEICDLDLSGNDWSENALRAINRLPESICVKLYGSSSDSAAESDSGSY